MEMGFWGKLKKPILALAPMANVTDAAFRRIIAKYGKPAVLFTEFVSADGLQSLGRAKLLVDLMYSESERPIVAQLFSGSPEKMFEAAKLVRELGFDGLDINMGCPDRSIEKSGAGAALIKNPRLAREIIRAAKAGLMYSTAKMYCTSEIPVSIKTRLGYHKDILEEWLPELLAEKPAAITIHARTRKEMSKVPARWERVKRAVEIRDDFTRLNLVKTFILGNGDVVSVAEARQKAEETSADGIMLGRAIFGNPWLFADGGKKSDLSVSPGRRRLATLSERALPPDRRRLETLSERVLPDGVWAAPDLRSDLEEPQLKERLRVMVEHAELFEKLLGKHKNFAIMKKHFKAYVEGFNGAKELRMKLMGVENAEQVGEIIGGFLKTP